MIIDFYRLSEENRMKCLEEIQGILKANLRYLVSHINGLSAIEKYCKPDGVNFKRGYVIAKVKENEDNDHVPDGEVELIRTYGWVNESEVLDALIDDPNNVQLEILRLTISIASLKECVAVVTYIGHGDDNFYFSTHLDAVILNIPLRMQEEYIDLESKKVDIANRQSLESCYSL